MYDRATVERLLPTVFDSTYAYGRTNPFAADDDMPRSTFDPSKSGNLWACIADMKCAWAKAGLTRRERQVVFARYVLDWRWKDITARLGIARSTAAQKADDGIGRLRDYLELAKSSSGTESR
jgi:hypothetical protein